MHKMRSLGAICTLTAISLACSQAASILTPPSTEAVPPPAVSTVTLGPAPLPPTETPSATAAPSVTPTAAPLVPDFRHILEVVFENKEFGTVVRSPQMPYFNELAASNTLLTQHFAVAHPSLPNYLAMIGGDTFGVTSDCTNCTQAAQTLPDLIEASGRTWKEYAEDMPAPCFTGSEVGNYAKKHNPFVYFDAIRLDPVRCARSVVPLTELYSDLSAGTVPDFAFITPNLCHDAHDCPISVADDWLRGLMAELLPALDASGDPYLVVVTWDEGQGNHSCCGLPPEAGGRIPTILVSPQALPGFLDPTPYTTYSVLKTIAEAWHLPYLGHAADPANALILAPWGKQH